MGGCAGVLSAAGDDGDLVLETQSGRHGCTVKFRRGEGGRGRRGEGRLTLDTAITSHNRRARQGSTRTLAYVHRNALCLCQPVSSCCARLPRPHQFNLDRVSCSRHRPADRIVQRSEHRVNSAHLCARASPRMETPSAAAVSASSAAPPQVAFLGPLGTYSHQVSSSDRSQSSVRLV